MLLLPLLLVILFSPFLFPSLGQCEGRINDSLAQLKTNLQSTRAGRQKAEGNT